MKRLSLALALLLATPCLAHAQEKPPARRERQPLPRTPRSAEIKALIERLGAAEHRDREAARDRLLQIGDEAIPFLERALEDRDRERAYNATEILKQLRWRVPEGLKRAVGGSMAIDDFPALPLEERQKALDQVEKVGHEARVGAPFIATIARLDPDAGIRARALDLYLRLTPDGNPAVDELLLETLEQEPPSRAVHASRARIFRRLGRAEDALASMRKAVAGSKDEGLTRLLLDMLVDLGQADEALPLAEADVQKRPDDLVAKVRLAEVYWRLGRRANGDEVIAKVLADADKAGQLEVYLRLERAFLRFGRKSEARDVVKRALAKFPYDRDVNVAVGDLDLADNKLGDAIRRYLNELRYTEQGTEPFRALREKLEAVLRSQGALELAKDDLFFEDARRNRKVVAGRARVGKFLLARALAEEAARFLGEAMVLDPESVELRVLLGDALAALGKHDEARRTWEAARAIDPKDERPALRLKQLAAGQTAVASAGAESPIWERRLTREALDEEPASVSDAMVPPVVVGDRALVLAGGTTTLLGLETQAGAVQWKLRLPPPPPPAGYQRDQVGLEPLGVLEVPSGVAATAEPARARSRAPLAAVISNAWARAAHQRSWRKAAFAGLQVHLIEPKDGRVVERFDLEADGPLAAVPPTPAGGRAVAFAQPRAGKLELVMLDLAARRVRWRAPFEGDGPRRPAVARDRVVAAWASGLAVVDLEGQLKGTLGEPVTSDPVVHDGAVLIGSGERLLRVSLDDATATELAKVPGELLVGCAGDGGRAFAAVRGASAISVEIGAAKTVWTAKLDKAATRELAVGGGQLVTLNGCGRDAFQTESPVLAAVDLKDGSPAWRRPVERPALLARGPNLVVVAAGGAQSAGLLVAGIRLDFSVTDARARKLQALLSAIGAALAGDELEVASLLSRRYAQEKGGLEKLDPEELVTAATAFSKSARKDEADAALAVAAAKDPGGKDRYAKLRISLGIEEAPAPEPPEDPKKRDDKKPDPKKPDDKKPGEKKPDDKKPDDKKPEPPKKDEPEDEKDQ